MQNGKQSSNSKLDPTAFPFVPIRKRVFTADGWTEYAKRASALNSHHGSTSNVRNDESSDYQCQLVDGSNRELPRVNGHGLAPSPRLSSSQSQNDGTKTPIPATYDQNIENRPYAAHGPDYSSQSDITGAHSQPNYTVDDAEDQAQDRTLGNCAEHLASKEDTKTFGDGNAPRWYRASYREGQCSHSAPAAVNGCQRDGSWTSSLVWESDEYKLRKQFKRIRRSLIVSGFGGSPFAPQNFCEYSELLRHASGRLPTPRLPSPSKGWNDAACADESSWPSLPAFQEAGDWHVLQGGSREFPQPPKRKLNGESSQIWAGTRSLIFYGLNIPCEYHGATDGAAQSTSEPTQELTLSDIHPQTRRLIEDNGA
ncbi:hypothetical protein F5Y07DRAFT_413475 [Xylaria sp. FL0933]|nr:hypothetical protein F5Y07DRAFT_413475 [Xylaria sp. FL0933]